MIVAYDGYNSLIFSSQFIYESERHVPNQDILRDIKKGVKLKHVRTNDRSKPNLRGRCLSALQAVADGWLFGHLTSSSNLLAGIRTFKRQMTKEERLKSGFTFEDDSHMMTSLDGEEDQDVEELRDDLESTKQLLELEVRKRKQG